MPEVWTRGRPLVWTDEELGRDRLLAIAAFIEQRLAEGTGPYVRRFRQLHRVVLRLFEASDNLSMLNGQVFIEHPDLINAARFVAGPPISQDDLRTLVQANPYAAGLTLDVAERTAEVVLRLADPIRFPWVGQERTARRGERSAAVRWTASLWCVEQIRTSRRMESSTEQQNAVAACLLEVGLEQVSVPRIDALEDLPPGSFTSETLVAGVKCDVPVRLHNRRLLAIECKVSNSGVNSVKRLNREVGQKAGAWRREFGEQIIPAAVLAGVFELVNLRAAQDAGITLLWAHDLEWLREIDAGSRL